MSFISVHADISKALQKFNLTREDAARAIPRALNKTATTARADASRQIRSEGYGIKAGDIKAAIAIRKATLAEITATLQVRGRPIPLIKYSARATKDGVVVSVKNGRLLVKHAFIATMPSGHKGVFVRVDSASHARLLASKGIKAYGFKRKANYKHGLPIRELFGPGIPSAFRNEAVQKAMQEAVRKRFPVVLGQELNYIRTRRALQ